MERNQATGRDKRKGAPKRFHSTNHRHLPALKCRTEGIGAKAKTTAQEVGRGEEKKKLNKTAKTSGNHEVESYLTIRAVESPAREFSCRWRVYKNGKVDTITIRRPGSVRLRGRKLGA